MLRCRFVSVIVSLFIILTVPFSVLAQFGYSGVYYLDEETGHWFEDTDGAMASVKRLPLETEVFGNVGVGSIITATAIVDFQDHALNTLSMQPTNTHTWVSPDGMFSVTVTALPFDDPSLTDMYWDDTDQHFVLPYLRTVAKWQFTYRVTNTLDVELSTVEIKDNFGAELNIESYEIQVPMGSSEGNVEITTTGKAEKYHFVWRYTELGPGESASITFIVATGKNPAGHQHYGECDEYDLDSNAVLKYRYRGQKGNGQRSIEAPTFKVNVCDSPCPSLFIRVSASDIEWFIRKPGEYFANVIQGTVGVSGGQKKSVQVAVTFSDFENLKSHNGQEVPVAYALGKEVQPGNWMDPNQLNSFQDLVLTISANKDTSFNLWQKVDLGTQSPGEYTDTGVITFTLLNHHPQFCH